MYWSQFRSTIVRRRRSIVAAAEGTARRAEKTRWTHGGYNIPALKLLIKLVTSLLSSRCLYRNPSAVPVSIPDTSDGLYYTILDTHTHTHSANSN